MCPSFRCLNARCSHMLVSVVFVTQNLAKTSSNTKLTSSINLRHRVEGTYLSSSVLCRTFRRRQFAFPTFPIITAVIVASTFAGARAHHARSRDRRIYVTIMWTRRIDRPQIFNAWRYLRGLYLGKPGLYFGKQAFSQSWQLIPRQHHRKATTSTTSSAT